MRSKFTNKGSFSANIATLVLGTITAQALPVIASPILTRVFSPDDFGLFGLYFSIVVILTVPITGRYEMAIILPEKDEDAINVLGLSILTTTISSILLFIISFVFYDQIQSMIDNEAIGNWIYLFSASTLLIGLYQSLNYWFNRKSKYKALSISRVTRSFNTSSFSIIIGIFGTKSGGLILGDLIGQAAATLFLAIRFLKNYKDKITQINLSKMKEMAKRYNKFPKYNVFAGLLEKGSGQMPVLLLTAFFGITTVGFFTLSQRIISAPGAIIARAFGDVFRQKASEQFAKNGECHNLFKSMFKKLLIIAIIPFTILFFIAPWAFQFVFGEEWLIAGEYTQIMTVMFFLQFVVSPLSNMFLVAEKQRMDLILQIYLFSSLFICFFVGYKVFGEVETCLKLFTAAYSIKYIIELYLSYRFSLGKKY